jgi:methylmalonyl-CoA/ethylmalonyl-CoA epimerase
MRIHHLGIAVESLESAVPIFELLLGKAPDSLETVEDQKVRVATFELREGRIELLESTGPDSPVARFVSRRGPGMHHLTLAVADLPEALERLQRKGMRLIDTEPRIGAGKQRIAFLHPSSTAGVLIELVEEESAGPKESGAGVQAKKEV